jgi:secreted trypsin-like serine protease
MFLKGMKKKKKKKKFRIEDEPCAHSENPPIYSHVDDFRDYVDRTYNNIDRRK